MGIDAEIHVRIPNGSKTEAEVKELEAKMHNAFQSHICTLKLKGDTIHCYTLMRYYGPGYERGPWPQIAAILRWLRIRIPDGTLFYGGDYDIGVVEFTKEDEDRFWEHFAGDKSAHYWES